MSVTAIETEAPVEEAAETETPEAEVAESVDEPVSDPA